MRRIALGAVLSLVLLGLATPVLAAPSCALLTNNTSDTNQTSFSTASVTLTANRLILLFVVTRHGTVEPNVPTATSTGATWATVDSQVFNTLQKISVLRTMVSSDQTGAIAVDFAGQTQNTQAWSVVECSSVDTSGTNGSGAVVTSNKNSVSTNTVITLTFSAYSSSNNRPVVGFGANPINSTGTIDWTSLSNQSSAAEGIALGVAWRDATDDTTASYTYGFNANMGGVGVEVKGPSQATRSMHQYRLRRD